MEIKWFWLWDNDNWLFIVYNESARPDQAQPDLRPQF